MRTRLAIALTISTLALAACSGGGEPAAAPTPTADANEAAFLTRIHELKITDHDDEALKAGYLVCKELTAGRIAESETLSWSATHLTDMDGELAAAASMSATRLCPDWVKG